MASNIPTPVNYPNQRIGLSPETKSTLWSGLMASALGATWLADTKIGGADNLLGLSEDKFESATKKIASLKTDDERKQALEFFKQLRTELADKHIKQTDKIFGSNTEINVKDLFKTVDKRLTTNKKTDAYMRLSKSIINKQNKVLETIFTDETLKKGITADTYKELEKQIPYNKGMALDFKNAFKKAFPEGSKPTLENIMEFMVKQSEPITAKLSEVSALKRITNCADEAVKITRENAQEALKRFNRDCVLDKAKDYFEIMRSKLPKARLKGAVKWFGIGIGVSVLANLIFGLFTRKNNK